MIFENMIVKSVEPKDVKWIEPDGIELYTGDTQDDKNFYKITKGAEAFLYKQMKLKPGTSKEVYKKSESIWCQLRDVCLEEAKDSNVFDLLSEYVHYLVDENGNMVDILVADDIITQEFKEKLNKYILDVTTTEKTEKFFTDGKGGLTKLICYRKGVDLVNEPYVPVILIEFNSTKSDYKVYGGILIYKTFTFIPDVNPYISSDRFVNFINFLSIDDYLQASEEKAEELYELYNRFVQYNVEISVREVVKLLNKVGYKLTLKDDSRIGEITNLNDETSNATIQQFFNTFECVTGETAVEVLSLSELQKVFRYNKLSFVDVLQILSKEYLTFEGSKITCEVLSSLISTLNTKSNDKQQLELIRNEIK